MEQVEKEICFLALTRPAMRAGVPAAGLLINANGTFLICMYLLHPAIVAVIGWFVVGPFNHFLMRIWVAKDHNALNVRRLWLETKGAAMGRSRSGGAALSPINYRPARKAAEVSGNV